MHGTLASTPSGPTTARPTGDRYPARYGSGSSWDPWAGVVFIREYHPYWLPGRERNPRFDQEDGRILDLKSNQDAAVAASVRDFARVLRPMPLPARTVLAIVPGHDARLSNKDRALGRVVAQLVADIGPRFVDGADVLVRERTVAKLATGGERSQDIHAASIRVANRDLVAGRSVVVLDDVTTTGNSLRACLALLREAGARRVGAVALARTV